MWGRFLVRTTIKLLNNTALSLADRSLLSTAILRKLGALPTGDIITVNESNEILVNGVLLEFESARALREGARAALNNQALRIVRQQVAFNAIKIGVHKAESDSQLYFGRAALWWGQQQDDLLMTLAGQASNGNSSLE